MLSDSPVLFHCLLPAAGLVVGIFGSFTGLGGAIILTPTLAVIFGLPYETAIGCSAAQIIGMAAAGAYRHWRLGHVRPLLAVNFLAGSIPGAVLGRLAIRHLTELYGDGGPLRTWLNGFYAAAVAISAAVMIAKLIRFLRRRGRAEPDSRSPMLSTAPARAASVLTAGFGAGLLAGLLAMGGGVVTVPVLSAGLRLPIAVAVGTSVFQMIFMTAAATLTSLGTPELDWAVIGLLLAGSVPGPMIGPRLLKDLLD